MSCVFVPVLILQAAGQHLSGWLDDPTFTEPSPVGISIVIIGKN